MNGLFNEIISKDANILFCLGGMLLTTFGVVYYKSSKKNEWADLCILVTPVILLGLFVIGHCVIDNPRLINYAANNKNNLISVNVEDTDNERVIMKFKKPDNSIKEIIAPVEERFTEDKKKYNKYSLKNIKDGYIIYYVSEDTNTPNKPTLKYFNGTKPLENVVKE